jgi:hypothetical protein
MSFANGGRIVTDGLVLSLDASDRNSYVSGSATWNDLSGNGNNFTLINSPSPTVSYIYFNGTNQRADCINTTFGNFGIGSFTLEYVLNTNGTASNAFAAPIMKRGSITSIGTQGGNGWADRILANIFFVQDSNPGGDRNNALELVYITPKNQINHIVQVITKDPTGLIVTGSTYINNILTTTTTRTFIGNGSVDNNSTTRLMFSNGENGYLSGNLYAVRAYNRNLSIAEVTQNYNAQKSRFNLK